MVAALGHSKDYSLKQYLLFAEKLQAKAKVSLAFLFDTLQVAREMKGKSKERKWKEKNGL